ncbi:MAG: FtsX-like permease family protein [Thermomicrobiales bacterium]
MRIFSILGAALASFLVANTISAVISEELTQIGVIKALGGMRRHVALTYLGYGALIGLAGFDHRARSQDRRRPPAERVSDRNYRTPASQDPRSAGWKSSSPSVSDLP